jgi:hypothetical protein
MVVMNLFMVMNTFIGMKSRATRTPGVGNNRMMHNNTRTGTNQRASSRA